MPDGEPKRLRKLGGHLRAFDITGVFSYAQ